MAQKKQNKTSNASSSGTKVTRIKATDDTPAKAAPAKATSKKAAVAPENTPAHPEEHKKKQRTRKNPFKAMGGYFKGSWYELKQVRWPTRKATWELTLAVILYSAFFAVIIILLDTLFKYLFELIIT